MAHSNSAQAADGGAGGARGAVRGTVLVIEDDGALGDLLHGLLTGEGYAVSILRGVGTESIRPAVARLEPDCILLDGGGTAGYGESWSDATWAHTRHRPVPVVMFTTDSAARAEALAAESERSRRAAFFAVLAKPFHVDELLSVVARAVAAQRAAPEPGAVAVASAAPETREVRAASAAKAARRMQLLRLQREVTKVQTALRSNHLEHVGLMEQTHSRRLTRDEVRLMHDLTRRAEAHRMRLAELRSELASRGPVAGRAGS